MGMLLISKTYWLGMPFNFKGELPEGAVASPALLKADDMREISGTYYHPAGVDKPKVGVLVMHPRADFSRHYCIPPSLRAGFAALGLNTRCINNDITAIHEELILDVNAGVKYLRSKGCEKVVLFGNSGGGSLFAFFQSQAQLGRGKRIAKTPGGATTFLNGADMVPADGFIAVSCHKGEGRILNECIDASVTNEYDPTLTDPALDMYNPDNGFAEPPSWSEYSPEFVKTYREAQLARVRRLDSIAHAMIDDTVRFDAQYNAAKKSGADFKTRQALGRRAAVEQVMTIYRTQANLHYVDKHLDPSDRPYGSLFSDRPDLMNYQYIGFGRVVTPHAWLSTWSGLSSNADLQRNIAKLEVPVLVVNAEHDNEIFPKTDAEPIWNAVTYKDKTYMKFDAKHYFEPPFGQKTAPDVDKLMEKVIPWMQERFA
ncbi:MAG: hypothetical protein KDH09_14530 [Chrysiogenetes bacterium]|nr:hypothetical protein [Chrysiogenetes bacterium]